MVVYILTCVFYFTLTFHIMCFTERQWATDYGKTCKFLTGKGKKGEGCGMNKPKLYNYKLNLKKMMQVLLYNKMFITWLLINIVCHWISILIKDVVKYNLLTIFSSIHAVILYYNNIR